MIYRALDENGDYVLNNGNAFFSDADAVRQAVITRLRQLIYEWWESLEDGVPFWQKIIAQRDKAAAEKIIRERIEQTDKVMSVISYTPTWDNENRALTINAEIQTEYGAITIEEAM
ncbi:hypothetical protein [Pectinatus haikarae]|uniref:Uncharacterized protein n=1 Tax=Pectinatus haikarae TaxID=349096 RepID=A0ABT9Y5Q3_9FIRM|nr:hypothetical protein [Pectinatus haikarae]MDQ0202469.1 hypothetical protein [Pectinatus haikarae]